MKNILVLYPPEFASLSKFARKVVSITKNLTDCVIVFPSDPQNLIQKFADYCVNGVIFREKFEYSDDDYTHAIIFDDGETFSKEIAYILNSGKPLRLIKIKITRVINIKKDDKYKGNASTPLYEYIGRGSYWGNPYVMHLTGDDRDEVIRKFKYDFDNDKFATKKKSEVFKLIGKRLGCFCKPEACHGDVLADFLNCWDDGK